MERVFRVDGQAADLRRARLVRARDTACATAVAVEAQTSELGGGELDGIPFQDDGGLGGVSTADGGRRGGALAEGGVDFILERGKGGLGLDFGGEVAGDGDVDDGAGRYVGG